MGLRTLKTMFTLLNIALERGRRFGARIRLWRGLLPAGEEQRILDRLKATGRIKKTDLAALLQTEDGLEKLISNLYSGTRGRPRATEHPLTDEQVEVIVSRVMEEYDRSSTSGSATS